VAQKVLCNKGVKIFSKYLISIHRTSEQRTWYKNVTFHTISSQFLAGCVVLIVIFVHYNMTLLNTTTFIQFNGSLLNL